MNMFFADNKFIVRYRDNYYDFNKFLLKHPGGVSTLKGLQNTDMTNRFKKAPPHSDAALYLMQEYKIEKNVINDHFKKGINGTENFNGYNNTNENNHTDESLEYLVDWAKPMLSQINGITHKYDEWVHKPVDRPLRLFKSNYLEMLTKTPWWLVPLFWIPNIIYIIYYEISLKQISVGTTVANFFIGFFLWTLLEYSIHRWIFHMKPNPNSPILCTIHFLLHGLHHKVPYDSYRLVFPPFPAVILALFFYIPLPLIFQNPKIVISGGIFGYLCYDLIHYYLHYGNPTIWHMYQMKRYHFQHHFSHQNLGFGISSPLWDIIFSTKIYLRNLNYKLKWKIQ